MKNNIVTLNGNEPVVEKPDTNPFADLESIRLSQDFAAALSVKKLLMTVPIRKPGKEWWIQTNPNLKIATAVLELKEENELYFVTPNLWPILSGEAEATFSPRQLVGAINRQNVFFIWPLRLPGSDGKLDDWSKSALEACSLAEKSWVRITSNRSLNAYELRIAQNEIYAAPEWPDKPFEELLKIAFKDRVIDTLDHVVLKRLRGEI